MFELRRLDKTVKTYMYFFKNEPEEFKENIDFYIDDLTNLMHYTNFFISSEQDELNNLYIANINLFILNPIFLFKPFVFILMKIMEMMMNKKSKTILTVEQYNIYFKTFLERLKKIKYLCDL